jgi:leader peptidase (prepilin peptidase)/N-methyltransferase
MLDNLVFLLAEPLHLWLFCGVLGLMVGSFLNVVIHRLPIMMEREWAAECAAYAGTPAPENSPLSLFAPRSRCPHCGHGITALENIPVLSYLWQRGRCTGCQAKISPRYPLVELLTGILSVLAAWQFGPTAKLVGALLLIWALIALSFIDLDTQLLPDSITLPLLWVGLLFNQWKVFVPLSVAVGGAICGYLLLWSVFWLFKLVTGKEGMGYGDFKLLAALGAWLGWQMLPAIVLLSSLVGAVVGILLIVLRQHGREVPIPFGPYLAGAGLIALFVGPQLTHWWLA